jgi:hypothetical protein
MIFRNKNTKTFEVDGLIASYLIVVQICGKGKKND